MPVDGAPSPGSNPYVSAATSAGSAAMSLLNSLRAAHDQQVRLENQQRQQQAAKQLQETNDYQKYLNEGAIPLDTPPDQNRPSILQTPQDPYGGHDPNRVVDLPTIGKRLYIPTTGEKEDAKQQTEQKYKGKGSARITGDRARQVTESGIQADENTDYAPGLIGEMNAAVRDHENATKKGKPTINLTDFKDAKGNPLPVMIDDDGNVKALNLGSLQANLANASGADQFLNTGGDSPSGIQFSPKKPAEKAPKSLHFDKETNDAGDVTLRGLDPETGDVKMTRTDKGIGAKRKDPDAEPATKPGQAKPAQFVAVERDKARRIAKAKEEYRKAITPMGGLAPTDDEKKAANDNLRGQFQDIQNDYEASLKDLSGHDVEHNPWADNYGSSGTSASSTPAKTPAKAAPQKTAAAKPAAKKYSAADVTAWAKKNGKDPADALKRARAKGLI